MTWKNKFINPSKFTRPQTKLKGVKKIVLHFTANHGAGADNHFRYFNSLKDRYASAHIFVDKIEALCIIPLDEVAYHANDGTHRGVEALKPNANLLSIGVEMCQEKDGSFHPDMIKKTEDVIVELCKRYKLNPLTDIVRHFDVTRKNCPAPWVANTKLFEDFKIRVNNKLNPPKPTPVQPTTLGTATINVDVLNIRSAPSTSGQIVGKALKNAKFPVHEIKNGWYKIDVNKWISNTNNQFCVFTPHPKPNPTTTQQPSEDIFFRVVVGSFRDRIQAEARTSSLNTKSVSSFIITHKDENGNTFFRVIAGSFTERARALQHLENLSKLGFEGFLIAEKR